MKPAKIVLLEPQFSGYSGMLCGVQFENGVSVAALPFSDQQTICASMRSSQVESTNVSSSAAYRHRGEFTPARITEPAAPALVPSKGVPPGEPPHQRTTY
ncbi:hypothetical protein J4V46_24495, partial [Escherichia coli]